MKKVLLFTAVVASLAMSCSKSAEKIRLEEFKNSLDNPGSFEFVEWGNVYADIELKHKKDVEKRVEQLNVQADNIIKDIKEKISQDYNYDYDYEKEKQLAKSYRDTAYAIDIFTYTDFDIDLSGVDYEKTKSKILFDKIKDMKYFNMELYDYIQNYADTAAFDTLYKAKAFKYRATNKFGALELMKAYMRLE